MRVQLLRAQTYVHLGSVLTTFDFFMLLHMLCHVYSASILRKLLHQKCRPQMVLLRSQMGIFKLKRIQIAHFTIDHRNKIIVNVTPKTFTRVAPWVAPVRSPQMCKHVFKQAIDQTNKKKQIIQLQVY